MKKSISWSYSDTAWLTLSLFAISFFLSYLWLLAGWVEITTARIAVSYVAQILLELAAIWWFIVRKNNVSLKSFRWDWHSPGELFGWIMQGYIMIIVITGILIFLQYYFGFQLPGFGQQESHIDLFGNSTIGIVVLAIVAIIIAPISEEFLFRGCIMQRFKNAWIGIVLSSAIFAIVHFELASFFPLFIVGIVIGYYYLKSNSLQVAIGIHILNNAVALIMEFYILKSGGIEHLAGIVGLR